MDLRLDPQNTFHSRPHCPNWRLWILRRAVMGSETTLVDQPQDMNLFVGKLLVAITPLSDCWATSKTSPPLVDEMTL